MTYSAASQTAPTAQAAQTHEGHSFSNSHGTSTERPARGTTPCFTWYTGFERTYGVLKRLGASPLGRGRWVMAKIATVLVIEVIQWIVLISASMLLGWSPPLSGWVCAIAGALLGTAAFSGLGLLMAGTLPGLATLAAANGLYLILLLTGGMIIPLSELPAPLAAVAKLLPAAPLAEIIIGSLTVGGSVASWAWVSLTCWAVIAPVGAALLFRWE